MHGAVCLIHTMQFAHQSNSSRQRKVHCCMPSREIAAVCACQCATHIFIDPRKVFTSFRLMHLGIRNNGVKKVHACAGCATLFKKSFIEWRQKNVHKVLTVKPQKKVFCGLQQKVFFCSWGFAGRKIHEWILFVHARVGNFGTIFLIKIEGWKPEVIL